MAFAVGGLAQFVAGIFEFCIGNSFGMTAFCSYGAFWMSVGLLFWCVIPAPRAIARSHYTRPSSEMIVKYEGDSFNSAFGLFLITWFLFTLCLFFATFRSSVGLVSLCQSIPHRMVVV